MSTPEPETRVWTIRDVLAFATDDFRKRGHESARVEAELLLARVLRSDRVRLVLDAPRPLEKRELDAYRALIARRRKGEPIAYILGHREFMGHDFRTDERALVPRPDTETLVEVALARTKARSLFGRALDLCTGTGCVALSFLLARPTWRMTATDVSSAALSLALENAQRLGALANLRLLEGDLFEALPGGERFELVTSNPPYIPSGEIETLAPDVRDFEPKMALDGGPDGLAFYRRLVEAAPRFLVPGGVLAVEVGFGQAPDVASLFGERGFTEIERTKDYAGIERVVSGTAPAPRPEG